jgi:hypothetical protein
MDRNTQEDIIDELYVGDTDGLDLVFRDTDAIYNDPQYTQY